MESSDQVDIEIHGGVSAACWPRLHYRPATMDEARVIAGRLAAGGETRVPGLFPAGVRIIALRGSGRVREVIEAEVVRCSLPALAVARPKKAEASPEVVAPAPRKAPKMTADDHLFRAVA